MRTRTVDTGGSTLSFLLAAVLLALLVAACATKPRSATAPEPVAAAAPQCWDPADTVGVYGACRRQGADHPHCICFTLVLQNVSPDPTTRSTPEERDAANVACGTHVDLDRKDVTAEVKSTDPAGGYI
jgi:hypothetical protein